jgi:hypothetical protein
MSKQTVLSAVLTLVVALGTVSAYASVSSSPPASTAGAKTPQPAKNCPPSPFPWCVPR